MTLPENTLGWLSVNPDDYALIAQGAENPERAIFQIQRHRDKREFLHFSVSTEDPQGSIRFALVDSALAVSDALFLISVLFFSDYHQDKYLDGGQDLQLALPSAATTYRIPHPPRMNTVKTLLEGLPVAARIKILMGACRIALRIWEEWAKTNDLTYFDGIMSMAEVDFAMPRSSIQAVEHWLKDGKTKALENWSSEYYLLHWPMLEGEWSIPKNVYYSLYAPCNLVRSALADGDMELAFLCFRQAASARATNGADEFLGDAVLRAFVLEWWRAAVEALADEAASPTDRIE